MRLAEFRDLYFFGEFCPWSSLENGERREGRGRPISLGTPSPLIWSDPVNTSEPRGLFLSL